MTFSVRLMQQFRWDRDFRIPIIYFGISSAITLVLFIINFPFWLILLAGPVAYVKITDRTKLPIALQGGFLGWSCTTALLQCYNFSSTQYVSFFAYMQVMSLFHLSEYLFTAVFSRESLNSDSFLLNHSDAYFYAAAASWIEFWIEAYFLPIMKGGNISMCGFFLCILGEIIRKLAMVHAGTAFTHRIAVRKTEKHKLVTRGIYSILRHPGYTGWLIWSVSTQLILCNPICFVAYAYVSWNFFNERIYDEERELVGFFRQDYIDYQDQVWVGIPFVEGYKQP